VKKDILKLLKLRRFLFPNPFCFGLYVERERECVCVTVVIVQIKYELMKEWKSTMSRGYWTDGSCLFVCLGKRKNAMLIAKLSNSSSS
jgi:hypothetical protein